jgi:hypothetical protein
MVSREALGSDLVDQLVLSCTNQRRHRSLKDEPRIDCSMMRAEIRFESMRQAFCARSRS